MIAAVAAQSAIRNFVPLRANRSDLRTSRLQRVREPLHSIERGSAQALRLMVAEPARAPRNARGSERRNRQVTNPRIHQRRREGRRQGIIYYVGNVPLLLRRHRLRLSLGGSGRTPKGTGISAIGVQLQHLVV